MEKSDIIRLHAIIEGYVQGVGFRMFVQRAASSLGLTGWVRNRWDGSVEVLAEGERQSLEKLLSDLHIGPCAATVLKVNHEWQEATGEFSRFQIKMVG